MPQALGKFPQPLGVPTPKETCVGKENRRIPGSPRMNFNPRMPTQNLGHSLDHLTIGQTRAAPNVTDQKFSLGLSQFSQRLKMDVGQIIHIHIIADASSIRRRIVVPIESKGLTP